MAYTYEFPVRRPGFKKATVKLFRLTSEMTYLTFLSCSQMQVATTIFLLDNSLHLFTLRSVGVLRTCHVMHPDLLVNSCVTCFDAANNTSLPLILCQRSAKSAVKELPKKNESNQRTLSK